MKRWNPREEGPFMDRARDGLYVSYEDYEEAADEIKDLRWLIENGGGPTHLHSTDYEPNCLACKWDIRYKKLFKEETDD